MLRYPRLVPWLLAATLSTSVSHAADSVIDAFPMGNKKVRIDGLLREWPGDFASFKAKIKGSLTASGMVAYTDKYLYVAVKAKDPKIIRTRAAGSGEDHATLELAFPNAKGQYTTHRIELYPGDPGKLPGVVKVGGRVVKAAKIVEAPEEGGLVIEAQLPWSLFPQSKSTRVGLKGALRYNDARARGSISNVVATSAKHGSAMPYLPLESEQALRGALLRGKGLSARPIKQAFGNVVGDSRREWVAVYGQYLAVVGPGYRGGKEFYFGELGLADNSQLRRLQLVDLSGDGRSEIAIVKRVGGDKNYREVLLVFQMQDKDAPRVVFSHEVAIVTEEGEIRNKLSISQKGITIAQGTHKGFDPGEYDEPLPGEGLASALLPWETVKSRSFEWKGDKMEEAGETSWKPTLKKGSNKPRRVSRPNGPPPPPPPRPPNADEMLDRVYALYRKDRGVGGGKPRFDFVTDVVGDEQTERVLVHGKDIVVFGKGFREGRSYAFINVGVEDSKDIVHATARDMTGDGKAEILVRGVLRAKASKELGGDIVQRYALFIYKVIGEKLVRIFAAETGRALGDNRVLGAVAFEPSGNGMSIELRAARAVGWSSKTYPFPEDTTQAGGLEPLLLPWGELTKRRYRYRGGQFSAE